MNTDIYWCPKHGLRELSPVILYSIPAGTYHRLNGRWRLRVKRRGAGLTWKWLKPKDPFPKRIQAEMLILNIC